MRVPSDEDKKAAHTRIEAFVARTLPVAFTFATQLKPYEIWPQKFFPETWELLRESRFAGDPLRNADVPVTDVTGLALMSILADCCAGETKARITDRSQAYAMLGDALSDANPVLEGVIADPYQRLTSIPLPLIDLDAISLRKLIEFRKREDSDVSLRKLRHRYLDYVETFVNRLRAARTVADAEETLQTFRDDAADDVKLLKQQLGQSTREFFFSKWVFATTVGIPVWIAAHLLGAPPMIEGVVTLAGLPATAFDILGSISSLKTKKREVFEQHPLAYVYQASRK